MSSIELRCWIHDPEITVSIIKPAVRIVFMLQFTQP